MKVRCICSKNILEHEEIDTQNLSRIKSMLSSGWVVPIVVVKVRKNKYLVLDGHHRLNALKELGFDKIPCLLVDYKNVKLGYWREEYKYIRKKDVIKHALRGEKFPIKTTRHRFPFSEVDYVMSLSEIGKS
jgi:hypothetical protein